MSTPAKVTRPNKITKTTPATAPATQPATESVTAATPATEVPKQEAEKGFKRRQINQIIDCITSSARTRATIDKGNLNKELNDKLKPLKEAIAKHLELKASLESATDDAVKTDLAAKVADGEAAFAKTSAKIDAWKKARLRFSDQSFVVLCVVLDEMVLEFLQHSIKAVTDEKKKMINESHLHAKGVEKLPLYQLFHCLPSFLKKSAELKEQRAKAELEAAIKAALTAANKEIKRLSKFEKKKEQAAPAEAAPAQAAPAPAEVEAEAPVPAEAEEESRSFVYYITAACKKLGATNVRLSLGFREYVSDLLVEFLNRLAPLVLRKTEAMKIKTVNDVAVLKTLESLLIDGHQPVETFEERNMTESEYKEYVEECKAKAEAKKEPVVPEPIENTFIVTRVVTFPTSYFETLKATVEKKLEIYEQSQAAGKEVKVE